MDKTIQELETQLNQVKSNIAEIDDIMKPYEEKRKGLVRLRNEVSNNLDLLKVEQILQSSREEQAKYFIDSPNSGPHSHKEAEKFFAKLGLHNYCYVSDTGQYRLQIALNHDETNIDETYEAIMFMLPFIKPHNGLIVFSILEYTLSEYESYLLTFDPVSGFWSFTTFGRLKYNRAGVFIDKDLKSVLSVICENQYYQE